MKISRKFATSPDNLVANGKILVANATVLVAMSSPVRPSSVVSLPLALSNIRIPCLQMLQGGSQLVFNEALSP